jgi:hypothetical protein
MSSRIEDIFLDLETLFKQTYMQISEHKPHQTTAISQGAVATQLASTYPDIVNGLPLVATDGSSLNKAYTRTSVAQTLDALVSLISSIMQHVRLSEDNADKAFGMVASCMKLSRSDRLRTILLHQNDDALWLMERHM